MKRFMTGLALMLALVLFAAPAAYAAQDNTAKPMTENAVEMTAESEIQITAETIEASLEESQEQITPPAQTKGVISYVFPDAGVVGAKWVRGDKIVLPFHVYSSGYSGQYMSIFLANSNGDIIAKYENKPFRSYEDYYTLNLTITGSENYAAGTYYILYYSSKDDGNLNGTLIPIYVENYADGNMYSAAFVDPDYVGKHHTIEESTSIPFKVYSMGYGAQEYFCGIYDSDKNLLAKAEGSFPLKVQELSVSVSFPGGLRPGTYYALAYSTYETEYETEFFPFYVDNQGVGWELDETGTQLTVFGSGAMKDYTSSNTSHPWDRSKITSLVVEQGVTYVGAYSCYFGQLTSAKLADSVVGIGTYAFYKNYNLTQLDLGKGLQVVADYAFNSCSALPSLVLPNSVHEIGNYAFAGCEALTNVTTVGPYVQPPADAYGMGQNAFAVCDELVSFEVPTGITSMGYKSFVMSDKLSTVIFKDEPPMFNDYSFYDNTITAYYPSYISSWTGDIMLNYKGSVTWEAAAIPLGDVKMTKITPHKTGNIVYWDAVRHADIYQVFRRAADETSWTLIKNTRSFAHKDESAAVGVKYYYKVRAYNKGITGSMNIPALSATRPYPLDSVKMTKILAHKTGNIVYWEAVTDGDVYQIYRRANNETSWTLIKNTRSLAYKDESAKVGVKYYYKVRARNGDLMSSLDITALSAVRPYPLNSVKMISAKGHATGIIVSWEAVQDAQLYQIYRRASNESSWTLIKNTGSLAYKDETAVSGVKYYYKVVARNGSDMSSMDINAVSATRP